VAEHAHPPVGQVDALAFQEGVHAGAQRAARAAEVIARLEPGKRAERQRQLWQVVEVGQPQVAAAAEGAPDRVGPGVGDLARVQCRGHQSTPSARAASMPDRQPSSWNPQPW
jgi:hypothetical protein